MKLEKGRITLLFGTEESIIELIDNSSGITFARVKLTPEQLSSALSRMTYTECEIELSGIEKLGKRMQVSQIEFEIPYNLHEVSLNYKNIHQLALNACKDGWEPDNYYQSQKSFFSEEGKFFARTTIRRWQ